jgi:hypothetical protein
LHAGVQPMEFRCQRRRFRQDLLPQRQGRCRILPHP